MLFERVGEGVLGWICLGLVYGAVVLSSSRSDDALPHDALDIPPLAVLALMVSLWPFFVTVDLAATLGRLLPRR